MGVTCVIKMITGIAAKKKKKKKSEHLMTFNFLCGISALSSRITTDAFCFPELAREILIFKIK